MKEICRFTRKVRRNAAGTVQLTVPHNLRKMFKADQLVLFVVYEQPQQQETLKKSGDGHGEKA